MPVTKEIKSDIVEKYGTKPGDTGRNEVQIALLTARIVHLTGHFKQHLHDNNSRRGLLQLVGRRRRLLHHLQKNDLNRYRVLIEQLGLRK